ncbi:flagellar basal body protein [Aestuariivirga sp.]|uniref:flagellar basal body protein n=1 Tax=Aestuariivirga sp. TaxID=2650926 RepID=UPI0039E25E5B
MYLFQLASQHQGWVSARQSVTASNIANADTPGYRARGIAPFEQMLERTGLDLAVTRPGHMQFENNAGQAVETARGVSWDTAHSGNNVSIEEELLNAGENSRMASLDTGITRSFQRMLLSSLKA